MSTHNRNYGLIYVSALTLVAAIAIITHWLTDGFLKEHEQIARTTETIRNERLIIEKIPQIIQKYLQESSPEQTKKLVKEFDKQISTIQRYHSILKNISQDSHFSPKKREALNKLLFQPPFKIDERLSAYITHAHAIQVATKAEQEHLLKILTDNSLIIKGFDNFLYVFEADRYGEMQKTRVFMLVLLLFLIITLLLEALFIFRPLFNQITRQTEDLHEMAMMDPLTGCHNRRSFYDHAGKEVARVKRYDSKSSVLLIDIDHFKYVNDTYGHDVGDAAIIAVANTINELLRESDVFGRLGGEEFGIIVPETDLNGAMILAEKIRKRIEDTIIDHNGTMVDITVSMGVTKILKDDESIDAALKRSDVLLYASKQQGRNQITSCCPE